MSVLASPHSIKYIVPMEMHRCIACPIHGLILQLLAEFVLVIGLCIHSATFSGDQSRELLNVFSQKSSAEHADEAITCAHGTESIIRTPILTHRRRGRTLNAILYHLKHGWERQAKLCKGGENSGSPGASLKTVPTVKPGW